MMQVAIAGFVTCGIALLLVYSFMLLRIQYRDPNLLLVKWGNRPQVYQTYNKLFPGSLAVQLYWAAAIGTIVFLALACYMQYRQAT